MFHTIDKKEVRLAGLQKIIGYIAENFDDTGFGRLLDTVWTRYRQADNEYLFEGCVLVYDKYELSGSEGDLGLQIWMHDRATSSPVVFQIKASAPGQAELQLVDVNDVGVGVPEMLPLMWGEGVTSGLQDTLVRFVALAE